MKALSGKALRQAQQGLRHRLFALACFPLSVTLFANACAKPPTSTVRLPSRGIAILFDTSGSYRGVRTVARGQINRVFDELRDGDCMAAFGISARSFGDASDGASCTARVSNPFDPRSAKQAREVRSRWKTSFDTLSSSPLADHTDVMGALEAAGQLLDVMRADLKFLLVFSDLEDTEAVKLPAATFLVNVRVRVLCVPREGLTPLQYQKRIAAWDHRLKTFGASDVQMLGIPETQMRPSLLD